MRSGVPQPTGRPRWASSSSMESCWAGTFARAKSAAVLHPGPAHRAQKGGQPDAAAGSRGVHSPSICSFRMASCCCRGRCGSAGPGLRPAMARLQPVATAPLIRQDRLRTAQRDLFAGFSTAPDSTDSPVPAEPALQRLRLSPATLVESAEAIDQAYADARARANEGVMLKAAGSAYLPGRRGARLGQAQTRARHPGRCNHRGRVLATAGVRGCSATIPLPCAAPARDGLPGELLNVGKAYSGVTDVEIAELTEWLKLHTLEEFGHFRTVEPLRGSGGGVQQRHALRPPRQRLRAAGFRAFCASATISRWRRLTPSSALRRSTSRSPIRVWSEADDSGCTVSRRSG